MSQSDRAKAYLREAKIAYVLGIAMLLLALGFVAIGAFVLAAVFGVFWLVFTAVYFVDTRKHEKPKETRSQ